MEVTYTAGPRDPSKLTSQSYATTRSVQLSPDDGDGDGAADGARRGRNEVNLVLRPAEPNSLEAQMDEMTQSYNRRREKKLRAVSVRMTTEEIKQIQLNKLFSLVQQI